MGHHKRLMLALLLLAMLLVYGACAGAVPPSQGNDPCAQCTAGLELWMDDKFEQALPLLEAGFADRQKAVCDSPEVMEFCAFALGTLRNQAGNAEGALEAFGVALEASRQNRHQEVEAEVLYHIGSIYKVQGVYDEAMTHWKQALVLYQKLGDRPRQGTTLNAIGGIYLAYGQYPEALDIYQQALAIRREVKDHAGEGITLSNIGIVYHNQGHYAEAMEVYQQALSIHREIPSKAGQGTTLNAIGEVYRAQGMYIKALETFEQALAIRREIADQRGELITLNNMALVYHAQGHYAEALKHFEQILAAFREADDLVGQGMVLNNIGEMYREQGWYAEAIEAQQQSLTIARELGRRADEGAALIGIGLTYLEQGEYPNALESLQQALILWQELGQQGYERLVLYNIGQVYEAQERHAEALEIYQQALILTHQIGDRAGEMQVLEDMGDTYHDQGAYPEALQFYRQALTIAQEMGNRVAEGRILAGIGSQYWAMGDYGESLAYYQQAADIADETGHWLLEILVLMNTATTYEAQGHYAESIEIFQQTLITCRAIDSRACVGTVLNNMGHAYRAQGHYAQAMEVLQQALSIRIKIGDRAGEGTTRSNIGAVYQNQGRYVDALEQYQQALNIYRQIGNRAVEGKILNNVGQAFMDLGYYPEALESLQQALVIDRETGRRHGEGFVLGNIGSVYQNQGRYAESLDAYRQALAIMQEAGDRDGEGTILNNIGRSYYHLGQYDDALKHYQEALRIHREVGNRQMEAMTLDNIGAVYEKQGRYTEALDAYRQAMQVVEEIRAISGSEEGRAGFIAQYADLYDRAAALYHQQGQDIEAFYTSERGRARAFLDSLSTGYVELSDNEAAGLLAHEQEAYAFRQAAQDALARARASDPSDPELVADLEAQLAQAEEEYAAALTAIQDRHDQLAALVPGRGAVLGVSEVQALLDDQTTLLSYLVLGDRMLAFILTQTGFEVIRLDVLRQELIAQVIDLREMIAERQSQIVRRNAEELYRLLVAPIAGSLHTSRLIIIPHGALHYLPFAALVDAETGQTLVEQHTLVLLPSASALPFIQGNRHAAGGSALVLGNPTIEGTDLDPLPYAEQEAQAIATLYGVEPLLGQAATEGTVRERVAQVGILHLAVHGSYNPANPLYSTLLLAPDAANDGRLEVHEVYGLDLSQADLVVLSACQTQLGELSSGDELVGLTRAFFFAGAPTVVASLWSVDDEATALLMERFYAHLGEGMSKAGALRQAQLDVRADYPEPYYWAGFVLSGDGGEEMPLGMPIEAAPTATVTIAPTATAIPTPTIATAPTVAPEQTGDRWCGGPAFILAVGLAGAWVNKARKRG